ncbi:hypothetical protein FB451DRAFT_1238776 [Mycena latifolia]|nr:hypothetical protein FB451DRAFT_1288134 [Mycena latifolia]KAJ7480924.1 hypothetical protein FB451DRAFT_1238776 [Mycena latifolia]
MRMERVHTTILPPNCLQKPSQTCIPPLFVLKTGDIRVPVWPNPPKIRTTARSEFCPKDFRAEIIEMYRTHLHQHPRIPRNDPQEPYISADDIHLWNRWYTPAQWPLWARASCDAIPRLKTTMVVESMWKHLKRRDLAQFNRPRLDLVTHLVLTSLLPRVKRTLDYVRGLRRIGRPQALAGWQVDAKAEWVDKSRSDEHRRVAKELQILKSAPGTKGRATQRISRNGFARAKAIR